jgi:hypothetical protein
MVKDYCRSVADQETQVVRESHVLCEIAGVLSGKRDAAGPCTRYRKDLEEKSR